MPQSTPSGQVMTGRHPNGHYQPIRCSSTWQWVAGSAKAKAPLGRAARTRKSWIEWHQAHGGNVSLTCRHFGISRPTLYRWLQRVALEGDRGLDSRSCRPNRARRRTWTEQQIEAVLAVRERCPGRGKMKIKVVLQREGIVMSASMIGRILGHTRRVGRLREPVEVAHRIRRRWKPRPWARRSTMAERTALWPGDLVQVDTKDIRPIPTRVYKQLTLVDVVSRVAAAEIGHSARAATMAQHLDAMISRLPFKVCGVQIDGGSEFKAEFEAFCQARQLPLYVLPPHSPKLNGRVERLQRTFQEEFYDRCSGDLRLDALRPALRAFEHDYNNERPHQALGYLTPKQYLDSREVTA